VCSGLRGVPSFIFFDILFDVRRLVKRQVLLCTTVQVARALAMSRDVFLPFRAPFATSFLPDSARSVALGFFSGKTCFRVA